MRYEIHVGRSTEYRRHHSSLTIFSWRQRMGRSRLGSDPQNARRKDGHYLALAGLGQRYPVVGLLFHVPAGLRRDSADQRVISSSQCSSSGQSGAVPLVIIGVMARSAAYFYVR